MARAVLIAFVLLTSPPAYVIASCDDTCAYRKDGECDDGGLGAEYDACLMGTDCLDCGIRSKYQHSPPPAPSAPARTGCEDSCKHIRDGDCDDGGPGAEYGFCAINTDCTDCGGGDAPPPPPPFPPPGPLPDPCVRRIAMAFVLDRSGSMTGEEQGVRAFAHAMLDQLDLRANHSRAAIITFSDGSSIAQPLTDSREALAAAINEFGTPSMPLAGLTNVADGLYDAYSLLEGVSSETYLQIVMLLSDGEPSTEYGGAEKSILVAEVSCLACAAHARTEQARRMHA